LEYRRSSTSIVANPVLTTTYNVFGITDGCRSNIVTVSVSVNPLPNISVNVALNLACNNSTAILTASGANTYTWNNGIVNGLPFTLNNSTTYTVYGTDLNGCVNSDSVSIVIPQPSVTASSSVVCAGETVTLTVTGANSYVWNTGNASSSILVTPNVTTVYSVVATTSAGCIYSVSITANVDGCNSIEKMTRFELIQPMIFPNPFTDRINITVKAKSHRHQKLKIFDMFGKIVYTTQIEREETEIDLSFLNKGVWFLEIDDSPNTERVKLLKN